MTDELIELNLKVAAIAGWTSIEIWNPHAIKKSYVGTNLAHPELGIHVPSYVESIDAITWVFKRLKIHYKLQWMIGLKGDYAIAESRRFMYEFSGDTEAIALCKLLVAISPEPIKPASKEEKPEEVQSAVVEASFQ
jgi:hypothetical protein